MQDKVSIITPSWNSEKYINKTIESVQKQTYMNWEMIIVDDCSSDRTVEIVEKISKEDPRVRIIRQDVNGGAAKARNRSLNEATGRYIAYLDADDIWKPSKLEKQVKFMKAHNCGFSCASYEVIDDEGCALNKEVHMLPSVDYVGFLTIYFRRLALWSIRVLSIKSILLCRIYAGDRMQQHGFKCLKQDINAMESMRFLQNTEEQKIL